MGQRKCLFLLLVLVLEPFIMANFQDYLRYMGGFRKNSLATRSLSEKCRRLINTLEQENRASEICKSYKHCGEWICYSGIGEKCSKEGVDDYRRCRDDLRCVLNNSTGYECVRSYAVHRNFAI